MDEAVEDTAIPAPHYIISYFPVFCNDFPGSSGQEGRRPLGCRPSWGARQLATRRFSRILFTIDSPSTTTSTP